MGSERSALPELSADQLQCRRQSEDRLFEMVRRGQGMEIRVETFLERTDVSRRLDNLGENVAQLHELFLLRDGGSR